MKATEHEIQSAFFDWLRLQKIDGVELAFAVPNGGIRHPKTAANLKKEGVKAGVPDVMWPVSRGGFSGLAIEFKAGDGTPTAEQRRMIDGLQKQGWCAVICWDWQAPARRPLDCRVIRLATIRSDHARTGQDSLWRQLRLARATAA